MCVSCGNFEDARFTIPQNTNVDDLWLIRCKECGPKPCLAKAAVPKGDNIATYCVDDGMLRTTRNKDNKVISKRKYYPSRHSRTLGITTVPELA